ncbi:MAG: IS66 family transposase, partial [Acidobacteriota bacterium]
MAEERIAKLEAENAQLRDQNAQLRALVAELQLLIEQLSAEVERLEAELSRHSGNSSKPPSSDTLAQRAAQNARRAEWKNKPKQRPGKQPGAQGKHLAQVADPDEVIRYFPGVCSSCGADMDRAKVVGVERRQVFDLPEPRLVVTEHVCERRRCSCGVTATATFPAPATSPASWGPRVRAAATYLLVRQHLPVARTAELLDDMLGAPVSTGWLAGLPSEAAGGLERFLLDARIKLADAPVLHVDETGARIGGSRQWLHVASTAQLTLLDCHAKRGVQATDDMGVLPGFKGVAVHDRWRPYWHYDRCTHAICGAHLLRDLAGVAETPSQEPWAEAMAKTLLASKQAADTAREAGQPQISSA